MCIRDSRSLNGVHVNGRRVEWSPLTDGDVIMVGRHTIHFLEATGAPGAGESEVTPAALAE